MKEYFNRHSIFAKVSGLPPGSIVAVLDFCSWWNSLQSTGDIFYESLRRDRRGEMFEKASGPIQALVASLGTR